MNRKRIKKSRQKNSWLQSYIEKVISFNLPVISEILRKWKFYKSLKIDFESYRKYHDTEDNIRTRLPSSEKIELHCVWVTEAYAPSDINTLMDSLKKLDWDTPEEGIGNKPSLMEWIQQNRGFGLQSSWFNGGIILSYKKKERFYSADIRRSNLPSGVDFARLSVRNVSSSLTLVTIQFVFDDTFAASLNKLFNDSYKTKIKLHGRSATYIGIAEQKRQEFNEKLRKIHSSLYIWFKTNLPGHYSRSEGTTFPTVNFMTSYQYKQTKRRRLSLKDSYIDLLFNSGVEIWKQKENRNLELRLSESDLSDSFITLFGNYEKLIQDTGVFGGSNRIALTNKLHTYFDTTLGLLAVHNLLIDYERQLSVIRDKAASRVGGVVDIEAFKNLDYIRNRFSSISANTQSLCNDLSLFFKNKNMYAYNSIDFTPPLYFKDAYPSLVELIRKYDESKLEQLSKLELQVNNAISSRAELTSAIANLRIQWLVLIFTGIVTVFTIISFFKSDPLLLEIEQKIVKLTSLVEILVRHK